MADSPSAPVRSGQADPQSAELRLDSADPVLVEEDLLVEEISIDGMCGVY